MASHSGAFYTPNGLGLLVLPANIRLGQMSTKRINVLAYYNSLSTTGVNSFIIPSPEVQFKPFSNIEQSNSGMLYNTFYSHIDFSERHNIEGFSLSVTSVLLQYLSVGKDPTTLMVGS
jgi:hypothetical protein